MLVCWLGNISRVYIFIVGVQLDQRNMSKKRCRRVYSYLLSYRDGIQMKDEEQDFFLVLQYLVAL